ncbi:MAG: helix-turn-helix transcriptional regulator [Myxococcales bacterium]|nr:helix-turn-helix transcriptional regulator [Myxococcales bacterium]
MDTRATVLANIAANVRRTRERRGLTQEQLAERCGLNFRYIQRVERAEINLTVVKLAVLADALGVSPGALFKTSRPLPEPRRGRPRTRS